MGGDFFHLACFPSSVFQTFCARPAMANVCSFQHAILFSSVLVNWLW